MKLFWFVASDPGSDPGTDPDPGSGPGASSQDTNWNSDNVPLKKILNCFN